MPFTETQEYKLEIQPNLIIQVRRADIVKKDGVEVGRTYHRHILTPGADTTAEPQVVKSVAATLWTSQVINDYAATVAQSQAEINQ